MVKKRKSKYYPLRKPKPIFKNRFFWSVIFILVFCWGIFYLLFFASFFQVKEVEISGTKSVSTIKLKEFIESKLEKSFFSIPSRSIFLVSSEKIEKAVRKNFPQIFQIKLKRKFPNLLIIQVTERMPVAIFSINDHQFLIDREGIVFEKVAQPNSDFFKIKSSITTTIPKLGDKVLSKEIMSFLLEIESRLKEILKISVKEVFILEEDRIDVKTSEGFDLYFNPSGDIEWQLTKLKVLLEKEIAPENWKNLEYIDLRFGNFAPYKYRE